MAMNGHREPAFPGSGASDDAGAPPSFVIPAKAGIQVSWERGRLARKRIGGPQRGNAGGTPVSSRGTR